MIYSLMAQSLTGYYIGIAIECVIIVIAGVLLALMLTGLLFKWMAAAAERREERRARKEAERAEKEAARLAAEEEERLAREEAERLAAEEAAMAELEEPVEEVVEEQPEPEVVEQVETVIVKKKIVKVVEEVEEVEPEPQPEPAPLPAPEEEVTEDEDGEKGIVFAESKTITELYEELTNEQKSFFDELREEALTKPDAELSMSRNFVTVKIGKRNLIKLLIKRGVTVAEFMLENEALKQLRLSNRNKKGKNAIRVKPTVVQVLDLPSLKVAVDMINLAYEELMLAE